MTKTLRLTPHARTLRDITADLAGRRASATELGIRAANRWLTACGFYSAGHYAPKGAR